MKFSQTAAQQLYPHLGNVECEKHGEQPKARVPSKLKGVFVNRTNPEWVCAGCVTEANIQWDEQQSELKKQKKEAKEAQREAIKTARNTARNADKALDEYVLRCQNAVDAVKTAEREIESTKSKITTAKNKVVGARHRMERAKAEYEAHQHAFLQLDELRAEQFEILDNADADVAVCYNVLKARLEEADALWDALGKAAKKKRDKSNRKVVLSILRECVDSSEESNALVANNDEGECSLEEPRDDGEQEAPE